MAGSGTAFGHANPLTQNIWSKKLFKYTLDNMFFMRNGIMGLGKNNFVQLETRLIKEVGDSITCKIRYPLTGDGQGDNGVLQGNEEDQKYKNFLLPIHERGHSTKYAGKMAMQRTDAELRNDMKEDLGDWWVQALENDILAAGCGLYNVNTGIDTVNELYPSNNRIYYGGQKADGTLSTAKTTDALLSAETATDYLFGRKIISKIKLLAKTCSPKIAPVRVEGLDVYVLLVSPYQLEALKNETGTGGYAQLVANAHVRGSKNPIFTGAAVMYDGVWIFEYDRTPYRTGAGGTLPAEGFLLNTARDATEDAVASGKSVARSLLLGRAGITLGFAQKPKWYEEMVDGGRIPWVGVDMLYGSSKTKFRTYDDSDESNTAVEDFAAYACDTQIQV